MNFILIAVVSGSLLTSMHETREACLGRAAVLAEQKINARCVEAPSQYGAGVTSLGYGTVLRGGTQ